MSDDLLKVKIINLEDEYDNSLDDLLVLKESKFSVMCDHVFDLICNRFGGLLTPDELLKFEDWELADYLFYYQKYLKYQGKLEFIKELRRGCRNER